MNKSAPSSTLTRCSAPTFQLVLYRRALHPELFQLKARKVMRMPGGDFEAWLMAGTHVLRLQQPALTACELVTDREDGLPTNGAVATFPCGGEKDFEQSFTEANLTYLATVQTETLSDNLFRTTYNEMLDLAKETEALCHPWTNADGAKCLSMLDIQRCDSEVHVQSYHLCATGGIVLRTQTIFAVGDRA